MIRADSSAVLCLSPREPGRSSLMWAHGRRVGEAGTGPNPLGAMPHGPLLGAPGRGGGGGRGECAPARDSVSLKPEDRPGRRSPSPALQTLSSLPSPSAHRALHTPHSDTKAIRVPCTPGALGRWAGAGGVRPELRTAGGRGGAAPRPRPSLPRTRTGKGAASPSRADSGPRRASAPSLSLPEWMQLGALSSIGFC